MHCAAISWANLVSLKSLNLSDFNCIDSNDKGYVNINEFFKYVIQGEIEQKTNIGQQIIIKETIITSDTIKSAMADKFKKINETIKPLSYKDHDPERIQKLNEKADLLVKNEKEKREKLENKRLENEKE